ncbi:MAG: ABC transporter, partial [Candidatus Methanomethylicota archaeon]
GGLKRRVEVAKVLIQKPKIAIFDEPTSQIDVIGRHEIWRAIRELRDEGSTILIATNNMSEAEALCDRVAIIHKGKLVAVGSISELKDQVPAGDIVEIMTDNSIPESLVRELATIVKASSFKCEDKLAIFYLNKGETAIPQIVNILSSKGYEVKQVRMKEPTLDDVFFYFTGASLQGRRLEV